MSAANSYEHNALAQSAIDGIIEWCKVNKMKLNKNKCQELSVQVSKQMHAVTTPLFIEGTPMQSTNWYKYLGIVINTRLDWTQHWHYVYPKISGVPCILRKLRHQGFREEILINIYRCIGLSHLNYSAPILSAADKSVQREMEAFQHRALRSIGISPERAASTYSIVSAVEQVEKHSCRIIEKILSDPNHAITTRLTQTLRRTGRNPIFKPNKARTEGYKMSVLQKHLRDVENKAERIKSLTASMCVEKKAKNQPVKVDEKKEQCPTCNQFFKGPKGLKAHQSKAKTCQ